jgi:hypothetical protein
MHAFGQFLLMRELVFVYNPVDETAIVLEAQLDIIADL